MKRYLIALVLVFTLIGAGLAIEKPRPEEKPDVVPEQPDQPRVEPEQPDRPRRRPDEPEKSAAAKVKWPPRVTSTFPVDRAVTVDPDVTEIKVTFDRPMRTGKNYSWIVHKSLGAWPGYQNAPPAHWEADERTCVLPVKLRPETVYAVGVNSFRHSGFRDRDGRVAVPHVWVFKTGKAK